MLVPLSWQTAIKARNHHGNSTKMCGIAGFIGTGDQEHLIAMVQALLHRGPDAQGTWWDQEKRIYLGHRRLSIIDLAGGSQPMWTADGAIGVIFNGEIYNHPELRATLSRAGHRFQTDHSDTEVLLHGYEEWQTALPEKLNGMWAFALYDARRGKLFLSRDRFGKKPLYYHADRHLFAFASELTALLRHPHIRPAISPTSLHKYFAYGYIPAPATIFHDIHKLPAGCNLLHDLNQSTTTQHRYWEFVLDPFDTLPSNPVQEWGEQLRELLTLAVKRRLMSDVPLGVLLSGGIDSSAVAALAAQFTRTKPLESFSIGFNEPSFDESCHAHNMAGHIGSLHHAT
ncbi:asparagine synthase (glutamine-hydrolyzing), partial [Candidatus Magnetominusculus xianensis]|uniref:asparagine synthase (glutamine-hydrolyzing) n=1 Tax=Candidatus Magnetominusculus xianensis TaxID=1748249 RepID=UPI000A0F57A5